MPCGGGNEGYWKEANYPTNIGSEDCKASRVEMSSRARTHTISSGESNVFCVFRGITKRLTQRKKWLIPWTKEKISSVQSSQLLLEVSAYRIRIYTEVNCQIVVSDFAKYMNFRVFHKNYLVASAR